MNTDKNVCGWSEEQISRARALDDALFWFGRPREFAEPNTTFALRFALRRALCLSAACEGRIAWQSFVNACLHCLGCVEEWRGSEIGTALANILRMDFCDATQPGEKITDRNVCATLPPTQGEV